MITQKEKQLTARAAFQQPVAALSSDDSPRTSAGAGQQNPAASTAAPTAMIEATDDDAALLVRAKFVAHLRETVEADQRAHRPESRQLNPEVIMQSMAALVEFLAHGMAASQIPYGTSMSNVNDRANWN